MTLRRQLLLLLLIHLALGLAAWDGYRIGYHKSRGETLTPHTSIEIENLRPALPLEPAPEPPERTDADWRGN